MPVPLKGLHLEAGLSEDEQDYRYCQPQIRREVSEKIHLFLSSNREHGLMSYGMKREAFVLVSLPLWPPGEGMTKCGAARCLGHWAFRQ